MGPQITSLQRNPHIIVGTPGRILKHMQKGSLQLNTVRSLVLDEADRMLDMGFHEEIMNIIRALSKSRQTLLFSATYPEGIQKISRSVQKNPLTVQVESLHDDQEIKQIFYELITDDRTAAVIRLLRYYQPESSIVFCNRKDECQDIVNSLSHRGFHALAIHGDLEQKEREQVLAQIANKSCSVLVATDVAARGLDIKELSAVINYELCRDPQVHVHRIGRTGRAGSHGLALSLFMPAEIHRFTAIEEYLKSPMPVVNIETLKVDESFVLVPPMATLCIQAGRKKKLRAGDILGALTSNTSLPAKKIGKIDLFDHYSYVAVERAVARQALKILSENKIKGRNIKVRKLK
jgi:ATP-independent RNA helicase DbpA